VDLKTILSLTILFFTALSTVGGALYYLYKAARKIETAAEKIDVHNEDIKIMMRCNLVCLDGLTQLGANGIVTQTKTEMERYLIEREVVKDGKL
jgi:hypothetical protein